jgi:hypothetical protein
MLVLMLVGFSAPVPVALIALAIAATFVGWLAVVSWPVVPVRGRLLRLFMLGLVVTVAVGRVTGWL